MWLTPTNGTSHVSANAFAADTPTSSAPTKPGPTVHATASIRSGSTPASTIALATTGLSRSRWARLAISGTTPPYWACRSTCVDTTLERTSWPPITRAAAVSSQLVSMPSTTVDSVTFIAADLRGTDSGLNTQALGKAGLADVVTPHDDGVLGVLVVALAHPCRHEPEAAIQRLGAGVADPHFQRHRLATTSDGLPRQGRQQMGSDAGPLLFGGDGDVGDVCIADDEHQTGVADDRGHRRGRRCSGGRRCEPVRARSGTRHATTASDTTPARCANTSARCRRRSGSIDRCSSASRRNNRDSTLIVHPATPTRESTS